MTKKGMKASDVFKLATGLRIPVKVNEYGQPIRAARRVLIRHMTKLVRQPNLCPPDMDDFNAVKNVFGVELLRVVRELSRKGKDARATQAHVHTTGTKSYVQVEDEYVVKNKKRLGLVKLFEITHTQKDGSFVQDESREFMTSAALEIDELRVTGSYENEQELESAVWYKLIGEDRPRRARGYGTGVTKSQVTGFRAQIKRMRSEEANRIHPNVQIQKLEMLLAQQQEMMNTYMARTNETIANLKDEVQIYRTAFGSFDPISSTRVSNPQDSRGLNENDVHNTSPNGSGAND